MDPGFNNGLWWLQQIQPNAAAHPQVIDVDSQGESQQSSAQVINVDNQQQLPPTVTLSEADIIKSYEPLRQAASQQQDFANRVTYNALNNNGLPLRPSNFPAQSLAPLAHSQPIINVGQRLANTSNDAFVSSKMPPAHSSVHHRGNDEPTRKRMKLKNLETATLPNQMRLHSQLIRRGRFDQRDELMGAATASAFAPNEVTGIKSGRNDMSEKHSQDDEGMFDDADEDIELPNVFLSMSVMSGPSKPFATGIVPKWNERFTLKSTGSDDDAFDDAEDDITQKAVLNSGKATTTDDTAPAPKTKKRQFSSLTKPIASQSLKEVTFATDLLTGKTELSHALPDDACRFLAENFWMFTVEQFEYSFDKSSVLYNQPERKQMRDDIRDKLAKSDLCAQDKSHTPGCERPVKESIEASLPCESMAEHGSNRNVKNDPIIKEDCHLVAISEKLISSVDDSAKEPAVNVKMEKVDGSYLNNDRSAAGDSKESVSHGSRLMHSALGVGELILAGTGAPSADASAEVTCIPQATQEANEVASSILTTVFSTQEMVVDTSFPVHAHLTDDKKDRTPCEARAEEPTSSLLGENERNPVWDEQLKMAERLLETWMKRFSECKNGMGANDESTDDIKASFSLKGPLGLLIPQVICDFLASVSVTTAYELLSVRTTEASPLVRALYIWRRHCGLQSLKRTVLARQMAGIVSRIDTALSSVPSVDSFTRKWMGSSLVCLTAAAKEFLIDECKLETPKYLLDEQPKEFTEKLVAWREARKMPPLKGSGKVAMICSWKAQIREFASADIGTGKITTEDEIIELSIPMTSSDGAGDGSDAPLKHTKPARTKTKAKKPAKDDVPLVDPPIQVRDDSELRSEAFLKIVFSRYDILEFLATVGIRTAEQLIQVDKKSDSPVVLELIKWRTTKTGTQPSPDTCIRCLYDWQKKVKDELEIAVEIDEIPQKKFGRPPKSFQAEAPEVLAALKEITESKVSGVDPISLLSTVARSFLGTLNITTAHALLSTRTTEISRDYVKWREDMKMNPLKGTGAIATISGWKGTIRKKATEVENDDSANQVKRSVQLSDGVLQSVASHRSQIIPKSHPDILMGLPRRTFFVQTSCDPRYVYEFELSVRQSTSGGVGLYLCFLGAKQRLSEVLDEIKEFDVTSASSSTSTSGKRPAASFLPVLSDTQVPDTLSNATNGTFAISQPGCGLIELSRYGVAPLPNSDRMAFRYKVQCFLAQGCASDEQLMLSEESRLDCKPANVLVEESSSEFGRQCFFYAPDQIEQGQVIELRLSQSIENPDKKTVGDPFRAIVDRLALARAISVLSLADLKSLIQQASTILSAAKAELKEVNSECGSNEELKLPLVKRRVHWIATRIVRILEERMETPRTLKETDASNFIIDAKRLLMTMDDRLGLCQHFNQFGKVFVLEELSHELLCDAVLRGALPSWDDKSSWCSITAKLLRQILRKASVRLLSSCLGDIESQKEVLKAVESYVFDAVNQIVSLDRDLVELAFGNETESRRPDYGHVSREFFLNNYHRLPRDAVADLSHDEAYLNAMELCGEVAFEDDVKRALYGSTVVRPLVLATKMPWHRGATIMRSIDDVKNGNAQLDEGWYINQILSVAHAIASSDLLEWESETTETGTRSLYSYARLADVARGVLKVNPAQDGISPPDKAGMPSVTDCALKLFRGLDLDMPANKAMPNTLPLFLAVVWPKLRAFGWCMEVGADPTKVMFYPPGHKRQSQRDNDRKMGQQRTERSRKRAKVERRVREAGFGEISKLTKRMFINAARDDFDPSNGASVRHTLKQFVSSVLSDLPGGGDDDSRRRLAVVEEAICECFDEIIPTIVSTNGNDSEGSFVEKRSNSTSYLMQVLLVIPALLEQTGLPMRRIEDTVGVIRELAQFISANNGELFEGPLRLCHEEYEAGYDVARPFLVPRMEKLSARFRADNGEANAPRPKSADAEIISEIVLPEDYKDLTDYSRTTLSQMLPCRATMNDIESKGRKAINVGHGGMVCRHCLARGGEGKYFFSSLGSLNTSANAVLAHLYKCKEVPDDLKARLGPLKARHEEDRKTLRYGSAAAFFSRLWMRLNSSCGIEGPEVYIFPNQPHLMREESGFVPEGPKVTREVPEVEFKSHTDLLIHIEKSPWNARADLRERIGQYYQCIAYGGELYMTNAMPKNFNSEWILSKMVPRDRLSAKRSLFLSG